MLKTTDNYRTTKQRLPSEACAATVPAQYDEIVTQLLKLNKKVTLHHPLYAIYRTSVPP